MSNLEKIMALPTVYQNRISDLLTRIYQPPIPVETEWRAITNIDGLYSPRIDIAVGPFSTERGEKNIDDYDHIMDLSEDFIEQLIEYHIENVSRFRIQDEELDEVLQYPSFDEIKANNSNARCLLAIEIENRVSRKHLLGGVVNASALGRLGIVVGWTKNKVEALVKLQAYWDYLGSVGKNTFKTKNLVILAPDQLREAIFMHS
jgi:hypothetical protein